MKLVAYLVACFSVNLNFQNEKQSVRKDDFKNVESNAYQTSINLSVKIIRTRRISYS